MKFHGTALNFIYVTILLAQICFCHVKSNIALLGLRENVIKIVLTTDFTTVCAKGDMVPRGWGPSEEYAY